jgi:hypothetical protein
VSAFWIASLHHLVRKKAVKAYPVVVVPADKFLEILDRPGSCILPQLNNNSQRFLIPAELY